MTALDPALPRSPDVPLRVRIPYAALSLPSQAISQTWALWLIYFYAPPADADIEARVPGAFGLDARVVLGIVLTAARLLEALDDPIIGYWSDRTRSRWGRRIPFAVLGTPLWALLFVLLFAPPADGAATANLVFLFLVAMAFFLFSNLSGAPLEALLPQIARRNADRMSIALWQVVFGVLGAVVGLSISSLLQGYFGFLAMAVTIGLIAITFRYVALAGCWQYALADNEPSKPGFMVAVREVLSNRQFLAFLPSFVLFQVALQLLVAALPFYVDTILADASLLGWTAEDDSGTFTFLLTGAVIAGMLTAVPFFKRWAVRAGKARAFRGAMIGAAAYFPALALIGLVPLVPTGFEAVAAIFIAGIPTAGVYLFPGVITADIIDYDETRTQTRREAVFYGAQNTLEKLATAVGPLIFALVLLAGDSREDPTGIRLIGPVAGALVLLAYLSFRRYSLTERDVEMRTAGN
jgi:GPH family glycoside/pentoside/hexuronide:cation symporter